MQRRYRNLAPACAVLAAATAFLAGAGIARAEGASLTAEGFFNNGSTTTTDETGRVSRSDTTQLAQRYRLQLDRQLFRSLSVSAGGRLESILGWSEADGQWADSRARNWSGYARLSFGDPVLAGALAYDRLQNSSESTVAAVTSHAPSLIQENWSGSIGWRPLDLPLFGLRLGHAASYDRDRKVADLTSDEAAFSARYAGLRNLDLRYDLRYTNPVDHLHGVDSTEVANSAAVSWSNTFFGRRTAVAASYNAATRASSATVTRLGGTVSTQALPMAGLSIVELLPATSEKVTLNPNASLIDGDTASPAGVDIGFGPQLAGDDRPRDLGVQLSDVVTPVNTVWVWVNQPLTANTGNVNVPAAFHFTAWKSDDNQTWTEVALTGPVLFGELQSRFEVPISETRARYLKVVTRPLQPGVTSDQRFVNILVTEVQLFEVVAARSLSAPLRLSGSFNTSLRQRLAEWLSYDAAFSFNHTSQGARQTWSLSNGLSYNQALLRLLLLSARLERNDSDFGRGHEGSLRYSAALSANPLPALSGGLSYSGQSARSASGSTSANSASLFARADLYQGVSLAGVFTASVGNSNLGQTSQGVSATATGTLTPHRTLNLSGSYGYSSSNASGGGQAESTSSSHRLDGTVSFSPVPALSLAGGVSRFGGTGVASSTIANFNGGVSPFPGGDLILSFGYSDAIDTSARSRNRTWGPTARWNVKPGTHLDLSYGVLFAHSPASDINSRVLSADLFLSIW